MSLIRKSNNEPKTPCRSLGTQMKRCSTPNLNTIGTSMCKQGFNELLTDNKPKNNAKTLRSDRSCSNIGNAKS